MVSGLTLVDALDPPCHQSGVTTTLEQSEAGVHSLEAEHDEYRRVDGRWLHARMELRVVFTCPCEAGWANRD